MTAVSPDTGSAGARLAAPLRMSEGGRFTLGIGPGVGPGAPSGVAVDKDGGFFVTTDNGGGLGDAGPSKVIHYSAAATVDRSYTITGQPEGHSRGLSAVVLDSADRLAVLDASTARVLRI